MKKLSVLLIAVTLAVLQLTALCSPALANWEGFDECEYCGEFVAEWGLCGSCGGCNYECNPDCWEQHHCGGCFSCLVSEDPSAYCEECCLCSDCWDDSIHCDGCYSCGDYVCPYCGLCNECADGIDLVCMDCGENHLCDNICENFDDNLIWHCRDCCVICDGCGECWHSRGGYELCEYCGLCPDCCEDDEYHCPECGRCYEEVGRCENGGAHCAECCDSVGLVCPGCGKCFVGSEDDFCEECGKCKECAVEDGEHCPECIDAHVECDDCGLCIDCAVQQEKHCEICGRCYETVAECVSGGGHCEECCIENEWLCPECEECTEATGNEICQFCGLCSQCCLHNSEAAGNEDGKCVYDPDSENPEEPYVCDQCGKEKLPSEMCSYCWLCLDCCRENSEAAGCVCHMCVNMPWFEDHDCMNTVGAIRLVNVLTPTAGGLKTTAGIKVDPYDAGLYSAESLKWYARKDDKGRYSIYYKSRFEEGYAYALRVTVNASGLCRFNDYLEISVNGQTAATVKVTLSEDRKTATFTVKVAYVPGDTDIKTVKIFCDDYPEVGGEVKTYAPSYGGEGFKARGTTFWIASPTVNSVHGTSVREGKFYGGRYWFFSLVLIPLEGYRFGEGFDLYYNGQLREEADYTIASQGDGSYLLRVFVCYLTDEKNDVTSAAVEGVKTPSAGDKLSTAGIKVKAADKDKYEISSAYYVRVDKTGYSVLCFEDTKAEKGFGYGMVLCLHAINGHKFSENMTVTVNGNTVDPLDTEAAKVSGDRTLLYVRVELTFIGETENIPVCDITGLKKIEEADPVQLSGYKAPEHVKILSVGWQYSEDGENYADLTKYGTYAADSYHKVTFLVRADAGYAFKNTTFTVNGKECEVKESGEDRILTLTLGDLAYGNQYVGAVEINGAILPEYGKPITQNEKSLKEADIKFAGAAFENGNETATAILKLKDGKDPSDPENYEHITSKDTSFEADAYYMIEITLILRDGYRIDENTKATVDGAAADGVSTEEADGLVYFTVKKILGKVTRDIDIISLVHINAEAPQAGKEADQLKYDLYSTQCFVRSFSVSEQRNGKYEAFSGKFAAGSYYRFTFEIEAAEGCAFTDFTMFGVNGEAANIVSLIGGKAVIEKVFEIRSSVAAERAEIISLPNKLVYEKGESPDLRGLDIRFYNGEGYFDLRNGEGVTVSPDTFDTAGEEIKVTLISGAYTFEYEVKVTEPEEKITGIEIITPPEKTAYVTGEKLLTKGLTVRVKTNLGSSEITDTKKLTVTPGIFKEPGDAVVTVRYSGFSDTFGVKVTYAGFMKAINISVVRPPLRQNYFVGDRLDPGGIIIAIDTEAGQVLYEDGKNMTFSPEVFDKAGHLTVTVKCCGLETGFDVYVCEREDAHVHTTDGLIPQTPASCTAAGVKEHYICTVCGAVLDKDKNEVGYSDLIIPKTAHKLAAEWIFNEAYHWKNCTECGARSTELFIHVPGAEADEGGMHTCLVCGAKFDISVTEPDTDGDQTNNAWIVILIVVCVLALAAAVVVIIIVTKKKKDKNVPPCNNGADDSR